MLRQLLVFELNYHSKQYLIWIACILIAWMSILLTSQMGSTMDFANSAYSINRILSIISIQIVLVVAVLTSATSFRDSQFNMEPLVYSTPIDKFQYLMSRFGGIFLASAFVYLVAIIAMMVTPLFMEVEFVGEFNLSRYVYGYFVFILPNIFICSAIVFLAGMLTKNTIAVYVAAIILFVIHGIGSVLGNSPIMVGSSATLQQGASIASLIDPYGGIAFFEQTAYWSGTDRNTRLPSLEGNLLFNRIIWTTIGLSLFTLTYRLFSFRQAKEKVNKSADLIMLSSVTHSANNTANNAYKVIKQKTKFASFNLQIWLSKVKIEYISVVKGKPFIILMFATLVLTIVEVVANIFDGPLANGSPYYPLTEIILELIQNPISNIGKLIAIFYAVELYWNERTNGIHHIVDATPTRNTTFYLAKLFTIIAICMTIISLSIIIAIIFQFSQGHFDVKPLLYLSLFYYAGLPFVMTAVFTFFMQRFANNRALGMLLGVSLFIIIQLVRMAGLSHPLTIFAFSPDFIFSDMTNSLYYGDLFHWTSLYWGSFCAILAVFTVKQLRRGYDSKSQPLTTGGNRILFSFVMLFFISGSYLFYQINIFNSFTTAETRLDISEQYERDYSQYIDNKYPTVIDVKVNVDIYPSENSYRAEGRYIIENQTGKVIDKLLIGVLKKQHLKHTVSLPNATLDRYDELHNKYFFTLKQPLQPGDKTTLNFELSAVHNAFARLDPEHYVTKGGSYFELEDVLPQFGFMHRYMISDEVERKKRGLKLTSLDNPTKEMKLSSDDWVQFETIVSTSIEQTAVTPGNLEKTWIDGDRQFFQYKTDQKIPRMFAYISAEFEITTFQHNDTELLIYHDAEHNKDSALIADALGRTMDYFAENYAAYTFKNYKVVELPYFSSRQSFGTAYPGMYLGVENRFFNLNNEDAHDNPHLRGVSHEFGHQYWGNYIEPNYIAGSRMVTETLAKYTEVVMTNKTYGEYAINTEIGISIDRYLSMRPYFRGTEKPLYQVGMQPHVFYSKGKQTMYALRDLIGEDNVNKALKNLVINFGYPKKPTSLDLINEFYKVSSTKQHVLIDDFFKRVVFHELKINSAQSIALDNGEYETTMDITTLKSVLNQDTNKEFDEIIDDTLEIAFYSDFPSVKNTNMTLLRKVKFNQQQSVITIRSDHKPAYIKIDPNRYRIDRSIANNQIKL